MNLEEYKTLYQNTRGQLADRLTIITRNFNENAQRLQEQIKELDGALMFIEVLEKANGESVHGDHDSNNDIEHGYRE
jgi:hypothetical protein